MEDIPDHPLSRSITLANDFLGRNFHRSFSWDTDYLYTPVGIDGKGKAWILLDFAKDIEPKPHSSNVNLKIYKVKGSGDSL